MQRKIKTIIAVVLMLVGLTHTVFADVQTSTDTVANNIVSQKNATPVTITQTVVVGENISIQGHYSDYENDPIQQENWYISHDPAGVDNVASMYPEYLSVEGSSGYNPNVPTALPGSFTKVGLYHINNSVVDKPSTVWNVPSFAKESDKNTCELVIKVQRKPTPVFDVSLSGTSVVINESSFDADELKSRAATDKGIIQKDWSWYYKEDGVVYSGLPTICPAGKTLMVSLTVTDVDGYTASLQKEAKSALSAPTTKIIAPDKVYVNQTFIASDISNSGSGTISKWEWGTTNNALGDAAAYTDPANKDYYIKYTTSGNKPLNLKVTNTYNLSAVASKTISVIAASITGTGYTDKYPNEEFNVAASTTNVNLQDHMVNVKAFYGTTPFEVNMPMEQVGTNSWNANVKVPAGIAPGSYTLRYEVCHLITGEVLSYSTKTVTVKNPPRADFKYYARKKDNTLYELPLSGQCAYYGNIDAESIVAKDTSSQYTGTIVARTWKNTKGSSGSGQEFEKKYTVQETVDTTLSIEDSISGTKRAELKPNNVLTKPLVVKGVTIIPKTQADGVIPEKFIDIRADITNGSVSNAANNDLIVKARITKVEDGITTEIEPERIMGYEAGDTYKLTYAFPSDAKPTDEVKRKYIAEYLVYSSRTGILISKVTQELPLKKPLISGYDITTIPGKTVDLRAVTVMADESIHTVRARIPAFNYTSSNMNYDSTNIQWSTAYTAPMVSVDQETDIIYEIVSKSTGMVVASDTRKLKIIAPTAIVDLKRPDGSSIAATANGYEVDVYDIITLYMDTTNATDMDYRAEAELFGQVIPLKYDPVSDTWQETFVIPKDYAMKYPITFRLISKAAGQAVITINKDIYVRTWLKNAIVIDKTTGNQVTNLIPGRRYIYKVESSLNMQKVDVKNLPSAAFIKMDVAEFELTLPTGEIIKATEDISGRKKTWQKELVFDYNYSGNLGSSLSSNNTVDYDGITYDTKALTAKLDHSISINLDIDYSIQPADNKFITGLPITEKMKLVSASNNSLGPELISDITVSSAEVYFNGAKIGNLALSSPTFDGSKYHYGANIFYYTIPDTTTDGNYTVTVKAICTTGAWKSQDTTIYIFTPINLLPAVTPNPVIVGETLSVTASTSKYTNGVSASLACTQGTISLAPSLASENKNWSGSKLIAETTPVGNYIATFMATLPNGKSETKTVEFYVDDFKIIQVGINPNPTQRGRITVFTAKTNRHVEKMWFVISDKTINGVAYKGATVFMDHNGDQQTFSGQYEMEWTTDLRPDGDYDVVFVAEKNGRTKQVAAVLTVKGHVMKDLKVRVIGE